MNTTNNPTGQLLMDRVLKCISDNDIQNYALYNTTTETEEKFFIKQECTFDRNKQTTKCEVTIYHDFEIDEKKYRGSSSFVADLSMSEKELDHKIKDACSSSLYVKNPYYPLPAGNRMETDSDGDKSSKHDMVTCADDHSSGNTAVSEDNCYTAGNLAEFVFQNDVTEDVFINSLEIFVTKQSVHIINSNGINVSYNTITYSGEFVVQAKLANDVELYHDFKYSSLDDDDIPSSLSKLVSDHLNAVKDRANAIPITKLQSDSEPFFVNRVILEGDSVYELFRYYLYRTDASMVYPGYSHYKIGDSCACSNAQPITITLNPKVPYSPEGIRLLNLPLISENTIRYLTGDSRFSYYLGIPASGTYESYQMECGSTSIDEMEKEPYLKIVSFSDFQMDEFTGGFGGEYRLAYYFDGTKTIPVTNGSISGNILDVIENMIFSSEKQTSYYFDGPLAISYQKI
ncbi:MAG: hypothetical protein II919_00250 [Lachnospiraceae bacterium]|nr:hypothetical protein [Lachnospiraceae bacterium]